MALVLALTGCAAMTGSSATTDVAPKPVASDFCLIAKPIRWSVHDTDETILQAKEQNAVGKKLCGWK